MIPHVVEGGDGLGHPAGLHLGFAQPLQCPLDLDQSGLQADQAGALLLEALLDHSAGVALDLIEVADQRLSLGGELGDLGRQQLTFALEAGPVPGRHLQHRVGHGAGQVTGADRLADPSGHEVLDGLRGQRLRGTRFAALLVSGHAAVVAKFGSVLSGRRGGERGAAAFAADDPPQDVVRVPGSLALGSGVAVQDGLGLAKERLADDALVLAWVDLVLVGHQPAVDGVFERPQHGVFGPGPGLANAAIVGHVALGGAALAVQGLHHRQGAAFGEVEPVHLTHGLGFELVDDQPLLDHVVADGNGASGPLASATGGGDLVAGTLGDHLALELAERHQHVEGQPAHGVGGVEILGHAHKGDIGGVEAPHDLGKVEQRAAQPVHLVDHQHVDLAVVHVVHQALEGRALQVRAGEAAVVVALGRELPAVVGLGLDESLTGVALRVERVELLLEPHGRGLAGVDHAAADGRRGGAGAASAHSPSPCGCLRVRRWSLKKRKPFQWVPVMVSAIFDRLA